VIVRPATQRPEVLSISFGDRVLVDAGDASLHQSRCVELPVLVAVGAKPRAAVVMVFVGEAYGDAIAGMRPDLLDQAM
jgi:hypothetical protein